MNFIDYDARLSTRLVRRDAADVEDELRALYDQWWEKRLTQSEDFRRALAMTGKHSKWVVTSLVDDIVDTIKGPRNDREFMATVDLESIEWEER